MKIKATDFTVTLVGIYVTSKIIELKGARSLKKICYRLLNIYSFKLHRTIVTVFFAIKPSLMTVG